MSAAVVGDELAIEFRDVPKPACPPEGIRIRVDACGLCGSDLHAARRGSWTRGLIPGHEIAGRIDAIGEAAKAEARARGLSVGGQVVVEPLSTCGHCAPCEAGHDSICPDLEIAGVHRAGGFAEFVVAETRRVYPVDAALPASVATLVEPLAVALHAIERAGDVEGQRVLVIGAGTIGLLCGFAARSAGAHVTLRARYAHQSALAEALGAGVPNDANRPLAEAGLGNAFDVVIETVGGDGNTLDEASHAAGPRGRVVVLGLLDRDPRFDPMVALEKELSITWANCYQTGSGADPDFARAARLLSEHRATLERLVTHEVPLDEIGLAFMRAADKREGVAKLVVVGSQRTHVSLGR